MVGFSSLPPTALLLGEAVDEAMEVLEGVEDFVLCGDEADDGVTGLVDNGVTGLADDGVTGLAGVEGVCVCFGGESEGRSGLDAVSELD